MPAAVAQRITDRYKNVLDPTFVRNLVLTLFWSFLSTCQIKPVSIALLGDTPAGFIVSLE